MDRAHASASRAAAMRVIAKTATTESTTRMAKAIAAT
jgi:hypothetical protein